MSIQVHEFSVILRINENDFFALDCFPKDENHEDKKIHFEKCWVRAGVLAEKIKNYIEVGLSGDIEMQEMVDLMNESCEIASSREME